MGINALSSAISGLTTSQSSIDVISNNIVNASTEGYTRKTAEQAAIAVDFSGVGVRVERVTRYVDEKLLRDFRVQNSLESYLQTRSGYLEPISSFHGDPELETNLHGQLSDLKSVFVALTSEPNSAVRQNQAIHLADQFANTLNNYAELILKTRQNVENEIDAITDKITGALKEIEKMNRLISPKKMSGEDTAELEDKRDLAVKELSTYMGVTYFEDGRGVLIVQTNKGSTLVDQFARSTSFDPSTITYASSYPENLNGVLLTQGNNSNPIDLAAGKPGGKLGALLELRDKDLPEYQAFADELAHKTALRFDSYGLRLFTDKSGVVPNDSPAEYHGFSAKIQVNQSIIADPSLIQRGTGINNRNMDEGSNAIITDVVDLVFGVDPIGSAGINFRTTDLGYHEDIDISTAGSNVSLMDFAKAFILRQSNDASVTENTIAVESSYKNDVQQRLLDSSGVNMDEELGQLIKYRQSYSAASQMITTLDEMFQDLLATFN